MGDTTSLGSRGCRQNNRVRRHGKAALSPASTPCGGECACATCHVYIDEGWLEAIGVPAPGSQEASMLSFAAPAQPNSRLSCQIAVSGTLDGLIVRLPEGQH